MAPHQARRPPDDPWIRLVDRLPEVGQPILLAHRSRLDGAWRVRDATLHIRFEEVSPRVEDIPGVPVNWWFDCIYPGKGDTRLASVEMLWRPMPMPDPDRRDPTPSSSSGRPQAEDPS